MVLNFKLQSVKGKKFKSFTTNVIVVIIIIIIIIIIIYLSWG